MPKMTYPVETGPLVGLVHGAARLARMLEVLDADVPDASMPGYAAARAVVEREVEAIDASMLREAILEAERRGHSPAGVLRLAATLQGSGVILEVEMFDELGTVASGAGKAAP